MNEETDQSIILMRSLNPEATLKIVETHVMKDLLLYIVE